MEIQLHTLTPVWTGGADQKSDRIRETGLIGSLRWWYEALVRGLGGYACDPTSETSCEYDPKKGQQSLCAACYLFGTTGWARLLRLRVSEESVGKEPLHFYTSLSSNKSWLKRIFEIEGSTMPFGKLGLRLTGRGEDQGYAMSQLSWALNWVAENGGIGAKLQHGFGQVLVSGSSNGDAEGLLKERIEGGHFKSGKNDGRWPSRSRFFSRSYNISERSALLSSICHVRLGNAPEIDGAPPYIPCTFDLRYKGDTINGKRLGFRQWLKDKRWSGKDITALMGETQRNRERTASRLFMSMPWLGDQQNYKIKAFGFAPGNIQLESVTGELDLYMEHLFGVSECRR